MGFRPIYKKIFWEWSNLTTMFHLGWSHQLDNYSVEGEFLHCLGNSFQYFFCLREIQSFNHISYIYIYMLSGPPRPYILVSFGLWGFWMGKTLNIPLMQGQNISSGSRYLFKHQNLKHLPRKASSQNETFCTSWILLDARYIKCSVVRFTWRLVGPRSHKNGHQSLYSTC